MSSSSSPSSHGGNHTGSFGPVTAVQAAALLQMKFVTVAIWTAVSWDTLITFALEIKYIYKQPRTSLVKVFWFCNRIGVPVTLGIHGLNVFIIQPSRNWCQQTGQAAVWFSVVNIFVIQATLCLRVIAMYGRKKRVTWIISFLLFGSTLARILILIKKPIQHAPLANKQGMTGCLEFPARSVAGAYWAPLIVDTVLFIMTMCNVGQSFPKEKALLPYMPLMVTLFRDGAIYFLVCVVAIAITVAGYYQITLLGPCTSSYLFLGIMSIACSRLVLHLREAASLPNSATSMFSGRDVVFNLDEEKPQDPEPIASMRLQALEPIAGPSHPA